MLAEAQVAQQRRLQTLDDEHLRQAFQAQVQTYRDLAQAMEDA